MAQIGGATPFDDLTTFAKESAELTPSMRKPVQRQNSSSSEKRRWARLIMSALSLSDAVAGSNRLFWGRFGAPAEGAAIDNGSAARYFNLLE